MIRFLISVFLIFFWLFSFANADLTITETRTVIKTWNSTSLTQNSTTSTWWEEDLGKEKVWEGKLKDSNFMINTNAFVPWNKFREWWNIERKLQNWLWTIIQRLMVPFWVLAVLVMVIWAGFMILSNWNDETLNKWKKIFKMSIFSLCLALSSYVAVELLKYALYY